MRRVVLDRLAPAGESLREAVDVISRGGVVAFPTETLYGLAVNPYSEAAVERLFAIKGRTAGQAVALVAADLEQVERWLGELTPVAKRLAQRFWPGPLTIVVPAPRTRSSHGHTTQTAVERARAHVRSAEPSAERLAPGIAAADGTVGVRVPDHPVARALCRAAGHPLTATSANLSGEPPSANPDEVAGALADRIDLLLDAGATSGGAPSTLVDASAADLRLVRAGAIDWATIQRCAKEE